MIRLQGFLLHYIERDDDWGPYPIQWFAIKKYSCVFYQRAVMQNPTGGTVRQNLHSRRT